jgi:hypothetical protein
MRDLTTAYRPGDGVGSLRRYGTEARNLLDIKRRYRGKANNSGKREPGSPFNRRSQWGIAAMARK